MNGDCNNLQYSAESFPFGRGISPTKVMLAAYRKSLAIAEALAARDTANTQWQTDVVVSCFKLGTLEHGQSVEVRHGHLLRGREILLRLMLDVNYGALVRSLFLKELGGQSITVIEPTAQPFPDAATTAAITTFEIGSKPTSVFFRRVDSLRGLDSLNKGRKVHRDRLTAQSRWSYLTRAGDKPPEGYIELGELCRVHRGQVTGANDVWIAGEHSAGLPDSVLFRTVTRARELFAAQGVLDDASKLRFVIDLPVDLDELDNPERRAVDRFLKRAREMGANRGYVASHRGHPARPGPPANSQNRTVLLFFLGGARLGLGKTSPDQ